MNISLSILTTLGLLFTHWFADFVCQTNWQAKNKSKNNSALFEHVSVYTGIFIWVLLIFTQNLIGAWVFGFITFVFHFVTDYLTSRLNTQLWEKGDVHNFFVSVGFDQWLHSLQLIFTYWYLFT